ncbi:hypothetical protein [Methylobacterium fujisawaense]|uniref:hypothetical protein n=1 Tax=Methylobacterium fujisawaense TaxID=107400 RepID=UPI00244A715E|nr:hypothetical protein [Methylobacterium fujisawaense]MDH3032107.1 hypothetical protein [Methylobacterium fujisawaense]
MNDIDHYLATVQVLTFNPRIRGIPRAFKVRTMQWRGALWLVTKDVGAAAGWHPDTFRHRRLEASSGGVWGYAMVPTDRGKHMMSVVDRHALSSLLAGSVSRQTRKFRCWLNDLAEVEK